MAWSASIYTARSSVFMLPLHSTVLQDLKKHGVVFCSISEAMKEYPELVQKYMGSVVSLATQRVRIALAPPHAVRAGNPYARCPWATTTSLRSTPLSFPMGPLCMYPR
jgi:hypothetical protein